jgi:glutamate 5-kinase
LSARKLWIAFAAESGGVVSVDAGARRALTEQPNSLLPAGVTAVHGQFERGDVVEIADPDGFVFARGRCSVSADQLGRTAGKHTSDLPESMVHEVVHRDDLVVLIDAPTSGAATG